MLSCLTFITEFKRNKNFTAHAEIRCTKNLRSEYGRNHNSDVKTWFFFFLDMLTLLLDIFSILVMTEFVLGNFASGFIALVNCIDWVKRQKVSSADGILTALAVSRIGLLWVILLNWYLIMFNPVLHSLKVRIIVYVAWTVSNHYSIWLATSLSIFYLFKITNFSSLIFPHLKWRVKSVVLMLMLGTSFVLVFQVVVVA